jgi:hypothetical protein
LGALSQPAHFQPYEAKKKCGVKRFGWMALLVKIVSHCTVGI